ncbi:hypothetical protein [Synechococcus sp. A15-60]|uniref:hypothetical protein n=1 Tax=Synechococcus sp. A15-60 TaxID=1050655 RepID=UPI000C36FF78|nr:hypothetical protein [Synechococcus sp. A15-60]MAN18920.1 hypothetical protein [Synechococcus sp. EAC657]MEC7897178.1 hypothetical protein [Cyanobacteriota bacterium]QNI47302.1 hypothetical protein SynA1560_00627 [Synechococcus sp. A15-60]|tara:strand:- start:459 stop:698 length:240 start_codon:yes stop_codon:yes gene_type:complete
MEIDRPNAVPLSQEQQELITHVRQRLESMVSSHGLTADDVGELIRELRRHPALSSELMQQVRDEVERLLPGQRFSFDWD